MYVSACLKRERARSRTLQCVCVRPRAIKRGSAAQGERDEEILLQDARKCACTLDIATDVDWFSKHKKKTGEWVLLLCVCARMRV